ncbi:MAG: penicillin-binding protein 2 [Bacteroidales bacterium]|nr:penicillin-binding protein 2 [Candidatus Cryptobacteroides aphodequi]
MEEQKKKRDRIGVILHTIYLLMLVASVVLLARIFYLQVIWKPDPRIERQLRQPVHKEELAPKRGNILASDGRILATSFPRYQLVIDPSVQKVDLSRLDSATRNKRENEWRSALHEFSIELASVCPQSSAQEYEKKILDARARGSQYLRLGKPVELEQYERLRGCELLKMGRNRGGVYTEEVATRRYPYGNLGLRTIGFVREPKPGVTNNYVGIDGKFDYILHGQDGVMYTKKTDDGFIRDYDSLYVEAIDGADVRTTLNIDYQDLADAVLRSQIQDNPEIEGGCCVIMEVETGAIRAMVNLKRDEKSGRLGEWENFAIGRRGEPGSVFKITTLMTALEDGIIKSLDDRIPTNHSVIPGYTFEEDKHITRDWEQAKHSYRVPIIFGVQKSSNYVFRYLALTNFESRPKEFIDRLYMYGLGTSFDFDIDGLKAPYIPSPDSPGWSKYDLGQIAMGYTVGVTPLHLITFYNAIANKGKMMKPYLIESIEKNGTVLQKRGPQILNAAICKTATADTLTRALESVTSKGGTGWRLGKAKCVVAGKTGTAYVYLEGKDGHRGGYKDELGRHKCQGTFVGYFPTENPQYSIICTIYSKLSSVDYYGGTIPAEVCRRVVDKIYDIDPYWNETL